MPSLTLSRQFLVQILDLAVSVFHDLNQISRSTLWTPDGQTCAVSSSRIQLPLLSVPKANVAQCHAVILSTKNICFYICIIAEKEKLPFFQYFTTFVGQRQSEREMNAFKESCVLYWLTSDFDTC